MLKKYNKIILGYWSIRNDIFILIATFLLGIYFGFYIGGIFATIELAQEENFKRRFKNNEHNTKSN